MQLKVLEFRSNRKDKCHKQSENLSNPTPVASSSEVITVSLFQDVTSPPPNDHFIVFISERVKVTKM